MDELKSMDEIKNEITEIDFGRINEEKEAPQEKTESQTMVEQLQKVAIVEVAKHDQDVQEKIVDNAKKSIDNELEIMTKQEEARLQNAHYDANKEACQNYGIDSSVPLWQIKMMKIGSAIWFCIYWVFASIIICPINVFAKALKSFIKHNWLVIVVAILMYIFIVVGLPLLLTLIK